ncbi:MAG: hypothetical protein IT363_03280 [Methanoregulaceae archaeon]|nr:hypothetical protein [Methanoregulaceae archaeon]
MVAAWLRTFIIFLSLLASVGLASAQLDLVWTRFYANQTRFDKVVVDVNNNVYCLGRQYAPSDTILVKYNASGTYQWVYRIMPGAPIGDVTPRGHVVDSAGNTYILYSKLTTGGILTHLDKVSPAGTQLWTRTVENIAGSWIYYFPYGLALDSLSRACITYTRGTSTGLYQWRFRRYNSAGNVEGSAVTTSTRAGAIADQLLTTQSGTAIWRFGPTTTSPATTIHAYPALPFYVDMPDATHLAYSPIQGGILFGVGKTSGNSFRLYRTYLSTGATMTRLYTNVDLEDLSIRQATCDADGRLVIIGLADRIAYAVNGARWAFKWEDLATHGDITGMIGGYHATIAPDRFGSILHATNAFSNDGVFASILDSINFFDTNGGHQWNSYRYEAADIAVNSRGYGATVGYRQTSAGAQPTGFVWFLRQNDLMNITVPLAEYLGGQTINATLRRYLAMPNDLVVDLYSNSAFATVPVNATIVGGNSSVTAPVTLLPTAVDRFVTLEARSDNEKIIRRHRFIVKAPRPTSLVLAPASLRGGANSTATVTMNGNAPSGGIRLNLASSNAFAVVPATALVPINQNRVNFTVTTTRPATTQTATISATYIGVTRSSTLTILP